MIGRNRRFCLPALNPLTYYCSMRIFPLLLIVFVVSAFSQKPDRWRGLEIGETTAEKAIATLGTPKSDKMERLIFQNRSWISKSVRESKMRILHYEQIEGFPDVKLAFDDAGKLAVIHLEPKKITAQAFVGSYEDLEFRFADEVLSPADFKTSRDTDKPGRLGAIYVLVSVKDNVMVFALVGNAAGDMMGTLFGGPAMRKTGRKIAGDVKIIQLISRSLENKDGSELLK